MGEKSHRGGITTGGLAGWLIAEFGAYAGLTLLIWILFFQVLGSERELTGTIWVGFWVAFFAQQVSMIGVSVALARLFKISVLPATTVVVVALVLLAVPTLVGFGFGLGCNTVGHTGC